MSVATMPTLLPHQALIKQYIIDHPHCGIFLTVGGGKTMTVLDALAAIRPAGHILVIAPINIARSTWINEIEKWGYPLRTRSLIVNDNDKMLSRKKRLERYAEVFTDPPTMYFISQNLVKDLINNMPVVGTGSNAVFQWPFQTVIVDESQGMKNPTADRFLALAQARPAIIRMILLSGTPAPNGLLDIWSQVYLLDEGLSLGKTITEYKNRYFYPTRYANNRPIEWEPRDADEIHARVAHLAMSTKNTSITMPKATVEDVNVSMTSDELEAYRDFKKSLVLDLAAENPGEPLITIVAKNQAVLTNKLVQFAAGTMYTDPDHNYRVIHDHKIQMTDYLIRNTDGPVIVAYMFRSDRAELISKLAALGHDARPFDGSRAMVQEWNEGKVPVMLLHPASAGHGLNFQDGGNTLIWYTVPYSLEHWIQTNGRLDRMGQKNPVIVYRLITKGTHDTRLPGNLEKKRLVQEGLISAVHVDAEKFEALSQELAEDLYDLNASIF